MEEALLVLARLSSALPMLACSKAQKHVTVFYLGSLPPLVYDCLYLTHGVILILRGRTSYSVLRREIIWILSPLSPCHAKEVQCGYRGSTFQGRAQKDLLHLCGKCLSASLSVFVLFPPNTLSRGGPGASQWCWGRGEPAGCGCLGVQLGVRRRH